MQRRFCRWIVFFGLGFGLAALAQSAPGALPQDRVPGALFQDLRDFVAVPAISGYEQALAQRIAHELQAYAPVQDSLGDVIVTVGSGAPDRWFATPLDEPGYVVSAITPDGFLRLQRLPTRGRLPLFNELAAAQPVRVATTQGTWINGVVAGLSVHLQPGRAAAPNPDDLDNMYVDVGAADAAHVRAAGVALLSPVVLDRSLATLAGGRLAGAAVGDRFGAAALVEVLRRLDPATLTGTLHVAFLAQQWVGARGLARVLATVPAGADFTYIGRLDRPLRQTEMVHWGIPVAWPSTPAETIDGNDLVNLTAKIETALGQAPGPMALPPPDDVPEPPIPPPFAAGAPAPTPNAILQAMVPPYGVNPHEARVAQTILALLPPWAHPITDEAGNISLHWGDTSSDVPSLLFVAHQDEIGFDVASIAADGRLVLRTRGGGDLDFYAGHPILVHTGDGMRPGVIELPDGWQSPEFKLAGSRPTLRADVGARTAAEAAQLGIQVGDSVTIPKRYRPLLGSRATARAFDDRVGDAALIAAAWALGPSLPGRDITLMWSVGEEIGLVGAKAAAERLAAAGHTPNYVFAIDTFVSSDSPLESHRFADAPIGSGFVIRAVDDSSITPWPLAQRMQAMAVAAHIPVQLGETGGGNDGSVFLPFGSIDLPLGWPLRYSHSPGEVIDTSDLDSLSRMVATLAHSW